jgi:hypothetical protein
MGLRVKGTSFRQIEQQLNITHASRIFKRAMERRDNLDMLRQEAQRLEAERMDALQEGIWDRATRGDSRAVEVALKILERRARLFGLDFTDMVNARLADIEEAKVKIMLVGVTRLLDHLGVTDPDSRKLATEVFVGALRETAA